MYHLIATSFCIRCSTVLYMLLQASARFMECVATFTCTELCSYKQFMFYALLTSTVALNRNELRKKVYLFMLLALGFGLLFSLSSMCFSI
jgi:hypothetical protein